MIMTMMLELFSVLVEEILTPVMGGMSQSMMTCGNG